MYDKRNYPKRNFRVDEAMLRRVVENKSRITKEENCGCEREDEACMIWGEHPLSLAMVCSPVQSFCEMYSEEKGLTRGTIFSQLDKPFLPGSNARSKGGCTNGYKM